jgi:hypothetical protein
MNSILWEEISQDKPRYAKICLPNSLYFILKPPRTHFVANKETPWGLIFLSPDKGVFESMSYFLTHPFLTQIAQITTK